MSNWEEMVLTQDDRRRKTDAYLGELFFPHRDVVGALLIDSIQAQAKHTGELADAVIVWMSYFARKEERERIIKYVEGNSDVIDWGDDIGEMRELKESIWQALWGKGE